MTFLADPFTSPHWQRYAPWATIILLGTLLYANTFGVPFTFDDHGYIVENPAVKDLRYYADSSLAERAIDQEKLNPNFRTRKLTFLTFALNYQLHGLAVPGYHLVNLLIHLSCGLLVYALVLATLRTPFFRAGNDATGRDNGWMAALLVALFFVAHPVQTQAVTYVCQRFTSLASLLYLLALVLYVHWRLAASEAGERRRWHLYGLALLAAVAAMFSKEIAFTLPVMVVLHEWLFFGRPNRSTALALLPFLATMVILPAIIFARETLYGDAAVFSTALEQPVEDNAALTYLLSQFRVIVTYLRLLALPINQNLDYDFPRAAGLLEGPVLSSLLLLCLLAGAGLVLLVRSSQRPREQGRWLRLTALGIFWFFLTLSVESSILPLGDLIFEHRLYLPSVGILLALLGMVQLVHPILPARTGIMVPILLLALFIVFSGATIRRNHLWRDPVMMGKDIVRNSPAKPRAHHYLATSYLDAKRYAEAAGEYEAALRYSPNPEEALFSYNGLEQIYLRLGNKEKLRQTYAAMRMMFLQSLRQSGDTNALLLGKLGYANLKLGRQDEAEEALRKAIALKGSNATLHLHVGGLYIEENRPEEGLAYLREAVRLDPEDPLCHEGLGDGLAATGQTAEALAVYQQAASLDPDSVDIQLKLAEQHSRLGNGEEAERALLAAVAAGAEQAKAHSALGQFYNQHNRIPQAEQAFERAVRLEPDSAVLHMNLGAVALRLGQLDKGVEHLNQAAALDPTLPDIHYNLGSAYAARGDYERAAQSYRQVLAIAPDDAQAKQMVAEMLQRAGQAKGTPPGASSDPPAGPEK